MKICIIQPHYSFDADDLQSCFDELLSLLDRCDDSMDLIVLPEYSDVLADVIGKDGFYNAVARYSSLLLEKAKKTAMRCHALLFVNAGYQTEQGIRNTTHAIDRNGNIVGRYFKEHPAPSEVKSDAEGGHALDVSYSYTFRKPYTLEIEGVRLGFLTCYDFYFYESFASLARQNVDVIIGCSLQRTDSHDALSIINRFLCYNTNAYLIRASVSLGSDSLTCGCSMVIAPDGMVLLNMKNDVGLGICEIDPKIKYYKPAGHMGALKAHYEYIEEGRRPWLYRNGGTSVVPFDAVMKYPRLCAYGGMPSVAPPHSLPSFASAIALGAQEIALDLQPTKDGILVCCSDDQLNRICTEISHVCQYTYQELFELDFGSFYNENFKNLKITKFEDVLQKFAGRVIMNIHIKPGEDHIDISMIEKITGLIRKYDCEKHVYFTTDQDRIIRQIKAYNADLKCCISPNKDSDPTTLVDHAIALGAYKIQLCKPHCNRETVQKAHANGILCNLYCFDDPKEICRALDMGVDTVLTDDFFTIYNAVKERLETHNPIQ